MSQYNMLDAAFHALGVVLQFERLLFMWLGVVVGLLIGLLPGIGGLTGFALLVPFTYSMDPYSGIAMLLGMKAASSISDPITSVLFGVPGESGSQATVLDGHAMAKKGEAGRALSAAYMASLLGGLIGAALLGLTLPIIRPFVLAVGTPELLAMTVLGVAMVAALSGSAPLRGIVVACLGILAGMIGMDVVAGQERWTGGSLYLWDGLPILPVILGLFALPELCDLAVQRGAMARTETRTLRRGTTQGLLDCLKNWFLILRCSGIGAALGAVPGITAAVLDWICYGHAIQTEKGAKESFTKGDVRGVIAPEAGTASANAAGLVPLLAFGIPGGAATAILLSALMVHGIVPGPDMLTKHLDMTYTMVWSVVFANIFGAGLCFLLSGQFAKLATLRYTLILPIIMAIVFVGAFQGANSWWDLVALLAFGVLGFVMRAQKWPRPPFILGMVLGALIERYMSISIMRYDSDWLLRPGVILLLTLAALMLLKPLFVELRHKGAGALVPRGMPRFQAGDLLYLFFFGLVGVMVYTAQSWNFSARIGPTVVGAILLIACGLSFVFHIFRNSSGSGAGAHHGIHMDIEMQDDVQGGKREAYRRSGIFYAWVLGFFALMALVGMIPALGIFIAAYMRIEGREKWWLCLTNALVTCLVVYIVFARIVRVQWEGSLLGEVFPAVASLIPSV